MQNSAEAKAGRVVGTILADLVFYSLVFGFAYMTSNVISNFVKAALAREAMRKISKERELEMESEDQYTEDFE